MSILHDIYDPPAAPVAFAPPEPEPARWTRGDLSCLVALCVPLALATALVWSIEPMLGPWVLVGGLFVVLESSFSAHTFLHRHPSARPGGRWRIYLAALVPWMIELGFAAALMVALFLASDWIG